MVILHLSESLKVSARWNDDGQLEIHGQDLKPPTAFGGEYEYWFVIPKDQLHLVASDIGADRSDGDAFLEHLAAQGSRIVATGEGKWLKSLGVTAKFTSWF